MWIEWYWLVIYGALLFGLSVYRKILSNRLRDAERKVADLEYINERLNHALHDKVLSK